MFLYVSGYTPSADTMSNIFEKVDGTSTPFVNRIREIRDIAVCNAEFVATYRERAETGKEIIDFRGNSFVFAAQMYGAARHALGKSFPISYRIA